MATTTVIGNVAQEIELRYTNAGKAFCGVTVAVNDKRFNKQTNAYEDGPTWFARGTIWGEMAENVHATVGKGSRVIGHGKIVQRDWQDKDGNNRSSVEIDFDAFGPDLRWAKAQVTRNERAGGAQGGVGATNNRTNEGWAVPDANAPQTSGNDFGGGFDDEQPF